MFEKIEAMREQILKLENEYRLTFNLTDKANIQKKINQLWLKVDVELDSYLKQKELESVK